MVFGNLVKNMQAAAYNGTRTVVAILTEKLFKMILHKAQINQHR